MAARRRILPLGLTKRGSKKLTTAKAPTWAIEMAPAKPRETPYRSDIGVMRKGVAVNRRVTAAVAAMRATGAPERPP